jgi:glycerol-3-phosphate dehydrogenase
MQLRQRVVKEIDKLLTEAANVYGMYNMLCKKFQELPESLLNKEDIEKAQWAVRTLYDIMRNVEQLLHILFDGEYLYVDINTSLSKYKETKKFNIKCRQSCNIIAYDTVYNGKTGKIIKIRR